MGMTMSKGSFLIILLAFGCRIFGQDVPAVNFPPADTVRENDRKAFVRYHLGEIISEGLRTNDCPIISGTVTNFRDGQLTLTAGEHLGGPALTASTFVIDYVRPRPEILSEWTDVDVVEGEDLLLAPCGSRGNRIGFAVSERELFPIIRQIISLNDGLASDPDNLRELPRIVAEKKNDVLTGFSVRYLLGNVSTNRNRTAIAMSQFFNDQELRPTVWGISGSTLLDLFHYKDDRALDPAVRGEVLATIVNVAGTDSKAASSAIQLLLNIFEMQSEDISRYVNEKNRKQLISNYQRFAPANCSASTRKAFEEQAKIKVTPPEQSPKPQK